MTQDLMTSVEEFRRLAGLHHVVVADVEDETPLGEYKAAEYIIFSLALGTYLRHLGETVDFHLEQANALLEQSPGDSELKAKINKLEALSDNPVDRVSQMGVQLLRILDRDLQNFESYMEGQLIRPSQKTMLKRTLRRPAKNVDGAGRRALNLRTLLKDIKVINGVFETAQARRQVKAAIAASTLSDGDAALDLFAAMPASVLKNARIRKWVRLAADTAQPLVSPPPEDLEAEDPRAPEQGAGSPPVLNPPPPNPIGEASAVVVEQTPNLMAQQAQVEGTPGTEASQKAQKTQAEILENVERKATEAAREVLESKGEPDEPPTRSEVTGIATAAAVAAMSDLSNPQNVPETIKGLDPEQQAAALTDGKVLVTAGAGAGKSTTLVSRVNHLVRDRGVPANRILVTSFNTTAAEELKIKIGRSAGGSNASSMKVGTMHSLFKRFVLKYGNAEEREAMATKEPQKSASMVARTVQSIWPSCFDKETMPTPKMGDVKRQMELWVGNDISVEQAKAEADTKKKRIAAIWYEMYEGLKGAIPGWEPPCEDKAREAAKDEYQEKYEKWQYYGGKGRPPQKPMTSYEWFMNTARPDGRRVGDFNDMIRMFRDVLKRRPEVRKEVQGLFDHILIDECQDLNQVQFQAFQMMTEHIGDGSDGKSVWMVGDDKQSIYGFRGARPDLFQGLYEKEGWSTRMIRTNYRCEPEIVEVANRLIAYNEDQIPMEAHANPTKSGGEAVIQLTSPPDEESGAINSVQTILERKDANPEFTDTDFAVLARTNKELHAYEAACLIKGVPYARKGASSFLGSPEIKGMLGYLDLVMGADNKKLQKALTDIINIPRRFWGFNMDQSTRAVDDAIRDYARFLRIDIKNVNPVDALRDHTFRGMLAKRFSKGVTRGRRYDETVGDLEGLSDFLDEMQASSAQPGFTVNDLFNEVLLIEGKVREVDPDTGRAVFSTRTFRDSIQVATRDRDDGDEIEAEDEEEDPNAGLGNISFLYELAKADPNNPPDEEEDPSTPAGFLRKMDQLREKAKDLRVDVNAWNKEQQARHPDNPELREPPPGVYLGTVHCSPPDEPILTTDGWVSIEDLDPSSHCLASYVKTCNQLFWGKLLPNGQGHQGYSFIKDTRTYTGSLVTMVTEKSRTRVTSEHRVVARFAESFLDKWVVYLMRRGEWWRVGVCVSARRPYRGAGVGGRLGTEKANAGWILGVFATREEALMEEARLQGVYGIPGLTFEAAKGRALSSEQLHQVHESTKDIVGSRALKLIEDFNLDVENPLYVRGEKDKKNNFQKSFVLRACNLLGGYMDIPVVSDAFVSKEGTRDNWTKPEWYPVQVSRERYQGPVYSLTVMPHRYYVSGGAVVHNSVKGAQWQNVFVQMPKDKFPMKPRVEDPEKEPTEEELQEQMEQERRLGYVALTRASHNLSVVCPKRVGGKPAGLSPFVQEAGLTVYSTEPDKPEPSIPPPASAQTSPLEEPPEEGEGGAVLKEAAWDPFDDSSSTDTPWDPFGE